MTMDLITAAVTVSLSIGLGLGACRVALETIFLAMARSAYCAESPWPPTGHLIDEAPSWSAPETGLRGSVACPEDVQNLTPSAKRNVRPPVSPLDQRG